MNEPIDIYETKCRRCGQLTEWSLGKSNSNDKDALPQWKIEKMNAPTDCYCNKCKKTTVQDVVSFNF